MKESRPPVPRALLLDLDGVLIDTVAVHVEAHRRVAEDHGITLTDEELEAQRGMVDKEFYEIVLRERGRPTDEAMLLAEEKDRKATAIASNKPAQANPGARELIEFALGNGVKISVVSSASREYVERNLRETGLWDPRLVLVAREDTTRGKPSPDPYAEAAKRVRVPPDACLAVEDAESGVLSSKAAGVYSVALGKASELRLKEADEIVPSLWELGHRLGWKLPSVS